ncbi:hydantoinase/oxoprolinase family protein [Prauserella flavalba]|uniref:N-methylhydantoinase A n=1 Tax=Prauserella flavalba TaxID=1477506 RepID=A0A318LJ63_9PSEU|nr:hydantoinase/oxoprolinase family protein [Prauserella flavalba]PXY23906.1 hypothetical protein BA062_26855 [Prauserella flavalba]
MLLAGVDIGGTFTDVVLLDTETGTVVTAKVLSTPDDLVRGVVEGVLSACETAGRAPGDVDSILHGTTVITNALIERRGRPTALLTNTGFRDVAEMGTEIRYDVFDLHLRTPEPLTPRNRRLGIGGRLLADGTELTPVDEAEIARKAREAVDAGAEAIAVSLLHSYANGAHEETVSEVVRRELGTDFPVTTSHDVAPEIGEFERTSTVSANAYVMPLASDYLGRLAGELAATGLTPEPHIMTSNGGFVDVPEACRRPVALVESGPAGGAIAAGYLANLSEVDNVLSFDMGGTTAKLCFLQERRPRMAYTFEAARLERFKPGSGLPLSITVLEMIEIGAGGGSIAHVDAMGLLAVGPQSAGAQPGPACYGRGGEEPTVTDADVFTGLIGADAKLGGHLSLDRELSRAAIDRLASEVGGDLDAARTAEGILNQVIESMAQAARLHAAERNIDLRAFDMVAFGGAGPTHAYFLAKRLGVPRVHFPAGAGVLSAYGFTVAESRVDLVRTSTGQLSTLDWERQRQVLAELREEAESRLSRLATGLGPHEQVIELVADMKLRGQGFVLNVPVSLSAVADGDSERVRASFGETYAAAYGVAAPDGEIELVSWRLTLRTRSKSNGAQHGWEVRLDEAAPNRTRRVTMPSFDMDGEIPVVRRDDLPDGDGMAGPLLVEDQNTSIVVGPDATVARRSSGDLVMTIRS